MPGNATDIGRGDKGAASLDCDPRDEADAYHTAFHEAGHAVAAVVLGIGLESVSIKKRWMPDGTVAGGMADFGDIDGRKYVGAGREAIDALPYLRCGSAHSQSFCNVESHLSAEVRNRPFGRLQERATRVCVSRGFPETPQVRYGQPLVIRSSQDVASKQCARWQIWIAPVSIA